MASLYGMFQIALDVFNHLIRFARLRQLDENLRPSHCVEQRIHNETTTLFSSVQVTAIGR